MSGGARRAFSLAILTALAAIPLASLIGAAAGGTGTSGTGSGSAAKPSKAASPAKAPPPANTPPKRTNRQTVDLPAGRPLPDSVVAVIDDDRVITVGDFRRGWGQVLPPARPDTLT